MKNLPKLTDADIKGKRVIVRADLDISDLDDQDLRLTSLLPTLNYLLENNCQIILIGHRGRPKIDKVSDNRPSESEVEKFSLEPVCELLSKVWGKQIGFIPDVLVSNLGSDDPNIPVMLENLRFDINEEGNGLEFAKVFAKLGDFFVNEAFGASHRKHASIISLPKLLPHALGLRFAQEVENLSRIFESPKSPIVAIISGIKDDKLGYIEGFLKFCDKILIGGRLPDYIYDASPLRKNKKVVVASLIADKQDLTLHSTEDFEKEILKAKTIVLSGPLGKYEEEGHRQATQRTFKAIVKSSAFKVAGGGDTQKAIKMFNLENKFDWISVGGGAMLEFLASGTLPGIEALLQ